MVWIIFQKKHLGGKDEPADLRFGASNIETHSRTVYIGNIDKKGGTGFPVLLCKVKLSRPF